MPSNMAAKTTFCLYLVQHLIVTLRCAVNVTGIMFSTFSLKFKYKISVQEEVIHNFKKITFWSRDQLRTYSFKENGADVKNQISIIFV